MPDKPRTGRKSKLVRLQPHPGAQADFVKSKPGRVWVAKVGCYTELRGVKP